MTPDSPSPGPSGSQERIQRLYAEVAETKARALTLQRRLEARTAELRAAQDELQRTNSELLQLTLELDARVARQTAELAQTVDALKAEVAKRALAEEVLWQRSLQLRALASVLTLAEQRERRRLAEVLHDDLQQLLVGARLQLNGLQRVPEQMVSQTALDVEELINQALAVSRSLTHELSPPILHEGELVPALEWLAHWMHQRHGLQVELTATDTVTPASDDLRVMLFQAVRELLFNVVKHAQIPTATLSVGRRGDQIQIVVEDAGEGFDPAQLHGGGEGGQGFGLFSIRERLEMIGGSMEIDSAPGKGSRFTLLVPLEAAAAGKKGNAQSPSRP